MVSEHRIIRRAFSEFSPVEIFSGTWVEAELRAMALQAERNDGEYLIRGMAEPDRRPASPQQQSGMDWL